MVRGVKTGAKIVDDIVDAGKVADDVVDVGKGVGNPVKIAGKGSTGRTIPNSLQEQMAMHQVQSNPLDGATNLSELMKNPIKLSDERWPMSEGWQKMSRNVNGVEIHFNFNKYTSEYDDFKFKN